MKGSKEQIFSTTTTISRGHPRAYSYVPETYRVILYHEKRQESRRRRFFKKFVIVGLTAVFILKAIVGDFLEAYDQWLLSIVWEF